MEVHVYLWKLVKLVQMTLFVSNLPLGVKNINFGIVFTEFEHSVIEASFIGPVEAEMKVKHTLSGYPGMLQWLVFPSFLLFLQTQKH